MSNPTFLEKTAKGFANYSYKLAKDPGNMLLLVGAAGWILSSAAHVAAIMFNDKIPKDQKKFLIPQEVADAVVNIASFMLLTKYFTKLGEHFVKSGKLATKELKGFYDKKVIDGKSIDSLIKTKAKFDISNLPELVDKSNPNYDEKLSKAYFKFADGVSFAFSVVGSIVSCNILTPLLRNPLAAMQQKKYLAQEKKEETGIKPQSIYPVEPVMPMQNKFGVNAYRARLAITPNSGSMRI